ncbi:MAG: hypothetical protein ACKO6N_20395 [Myxococcota bacterium]
MSTLPPCQHLKRCATRGPSPVQLIMLSLLLTACGTQEQPEGPDCSRTPALTYENFGRGFLERNCTGCHSSYLTDMKERNYAPLSVNLNTYADAILWLDRIDVRTVQDQDMPPAGGLSSNDLDMLHEWLNCEVRSDAQALEEESP